jgi:hypothetical protein
MTANTPPGVTLSVSAHVSGDWIEVSYVLESRGDAVWLAYDAAAGALGAVPPPLSESVPMSFVAPSTLRIMQIRPPLPADVDVTFVKIPFARRLEPGGRLEGSFRVKRPVAERNELTPDHPGATYEERSADALELLIGGFVPRKDTQLDPIAAGPGAFRVKGAFGAQSIVAATAPLATPVTVRVRTDAGFDRL